MNQAVTRSASGQHSSGAPPRRSRRRGWIFPAIALGLFSLLGVAIYRANQPYFDWDLAISHSVQGISWFGLESLLRGVCLADNDLLQAFLLVAGTGLLLAALRARREAAMLIGVAVVGQALCTLTGELVKRPRPSTELIQLRIDPKEIEGFPSFPSGHTVHYTVFFGFLGFLAATRLKPPALSWPLLSVLAGLVLLVGPARIYLGAHWISDVLGGYLLGGAVLVSGVNLHRRWSSRSGNPEVSALRDPGELPL
jgi:membrane-associated phospholipid phosphatase